MIQYEGHAATVCSLAFSPDSMTLASGAKDGGVRLWDAAGGLVRVMSIAVDIACNAVAWSPSGTMLSTALGATITSYPHPDGRCSVGEFYTVQGFVVSLAFLSDNLLAIGTGGVAGGNSGCLHLWDTVQKIRRPIPAPLQKSNGVRSVVAHQPTKRLHWIAGLPNTTACVWRSWCITSPSATDVKLNKPAADIAASPDGATVAIASDWLVRVFAADGKPKTDLSGHKGQVAGVGFIHGGRTVVSASWDETVRFWDVATGKETARFPLTIGKLTTLAVSPDGTRVAAGGTDGPIIVIDTE